MNVRKVIEKVGKALGRIDTWIGAPALERNPNAVPVTVWYQNPSHMIAKDKGEWYLHTVLGR